MLKRDGSKIVQHVVLWLSCPERITMKAEERKADEKHLYREKNMRRYMKSICCVVFGLCEEACPKDAFT
jgi:NADH-quinone oxidoreductase subunit I